MRKMKTKLKWIYLLLFIAGLFVLLFPVYAPFITGLRMKTLAKQYDKMTASSAFSEERSQIEIYNKTLVGAKAEDLLAAYDGKTDDRYLSLLNPTKNGMMAYITFNEKTVVPIFQHGTKKNGTPGLVHLGGTSLPLGGPGTHVVLHLTSDFTTKNVKKEIIALSTGDRFTLKVLGELRYYEVEEVTTISASDTEALNVVSGQDFITILISDKEKQVLIRAHFLPTTYVEGPLEEASKENEE